MLKEGFRKLFNIFMNSGFILRLIKFKIKSKMEVVMVCICMFMRFCVIEKVGLR